jgi:hypothetical protein
MTTAFLDAVHTDPWSEEFIDLPVLNARASDAIEERVTRARDSARREPRALRASSLVILGPPGAGKTHLFGRLRRRLGPRAVFVHVRPLVHAPITPRFLLQEMVGQLNRETDGHTQLRALVGSLLAHLCGVSAKFPGTFLNEYATFSQEERGERLDAAIEQVLELWPETEETYLRRLLQAPFEQGGTQRAILAWLSGRDCEASQLARIGATASLSEELAIPALRTLCSVAALGAPIVLVLDQLENLIEGQEAGPRLLGYANLSAELVDSMRGLVLVHMALDTEWSRGIEPALNLSQRSRVLMARETLALPTAREREDLLRLWIDRLPEKKAPFPWPLSDAKLLALLKTPGCTPRMLMVECRTALENGPDDAGPEGAGTHHPTESPPLNLTGEWESRLSEARQTLQQADEQRACVEAARIADGCIAASEFLPGVRITSSIAPAPIHLDVTSGTVKARLAVLDQGHHRQLGSVLDKLAALATMHPVLVVREHTHEIPPTWKETLKKRATLLASNNARWLWLTPEDAARLLALDAFVQAARSRDLTNDRGEPVDPAVVSAWIAENLRVPEWPICRGFAPADATKDPDPTTAEVGSPPEPSPPPEPRPTGAAMAVLRQLGLASLERVVREANRIDPASTRAAVLSELRARTDVKFFGRTIVCVRLAT